MLENAHFTTLVAVRVLHEAKAFYGDKLQLTKVREEAGWTQYRSGTSDLIVYESEYAGTNQASTAAWTVDDVEATVAEIKSAGISSFQQYDLPGTTIDGDVHHADEVKMAWFKDPSGNILEVNGR